MPTTTKKRSSTKTGSALEEKLLAQLKEHKFPTPITQHPFGQENGRKWTVDFYWPDSNLIVEVQGGTWIRGRHSRGTGARTDAEKLNYCAARGIWTVYVTTDMITDGTALDWIYVNLTMANPQRMEKYVNGRKEKYPKGAFPDYWTGFNAEVVCRFKGTKRRRTGRKNKGGGKRKSAGVSKKSRVSSRIF